MQTEQVACPHCGSDDAMPWAEELGFVVVRCRGCRLIYINPRPTRADITSAVTTGAHKLQSGMLNVRARRVGSRITKYRRDLGALFGDRLAAGPVRWLDVGAGYGELIEAVQQLAQPGSSVRGVEPMAHKAADSQARGLAVRHGFLAPEDGPADVISLIDVFSHLPDFGAMLADMRAVLAPGGELLIETGNLADLERRSEFAGELGLPDHLVFCGADHLARWLDRAGFDVVRIVAHRHDGIADQIKNAVKLALGRPARLALPYRSAYRQLQVRARLR
jgi:2-polyprenyl-3-methyl-5-hydroxy-6-metoxy-1,4-benzoquinol methylase